MANTRVCILGNNACAWKIADTLSEAGADVILATRDESPHPPRVCRATGSPAQEVLCGARLASCRGGIGHFDLAFSQNGTDVRRTVASVVIAESDERRPNHALYGLTPGAGVAPLSELPDDGSLPPTNGSPLKHAAFLNGLVAESHPLIAGEIMRAALRLQTEHQVQCTILTRNLKVAGDGLEALSREARSAGVLFFKFTTSTPAIRQDPDGRVQMAFIDELTGQEFALAPDLVVLDETPAPSAYAVELGRILGLESDPVGFVQGDNVHRLTALTNRRGVVVAGPSRGIGLDPAVEASNAVLEALERGGFHRGRAFAECRDRIRPLHPLSDLLAGVSLPRGAAERAADHPAGRLRALRSFAPPNARGRPSASPAWSATTCVRSSPPAGGRPRRSRMSLLSAAAARPALPRRPRWTRGRAGQPW